ncbi:ribonuclease inhibitor-like [Cyprinus carpio]|uniref:Ribonuclease inhibitor-like n=1 Tax=Cyprinus carpio TaxID=7962 RepID=A0A9Q9WN03_CYPCA|nr:ribonuclease inhibitor-like [Cyprinus carpio]
MVVEIARKMKVLPDLARVIEKGQRRLIPAVINCRKALLYDCGITDEGCSALTSALRSNPSHLRDLDLSWNNNLGDSGVKRLCAVLEDPHCKLEKLWLRYCDVTDEGCSALTSALRSNPSHLRELNLSVNNLRDSGVKESLCWTGGSSL